MTGSFIGQSTVKDAAVMPDTLHEYTANRATGRDSRAAVTCDAFISYSHAKDKPIATALQAVVQKLGKAWLPSSRAAAISPPLADTRPVAAPR